MENITHGVLLLDGRDVTRSEGIAVQQGGYANLLAYPSLVEPAGNEWWEGDGYEWDLSAPAAAPRSVSLPLIHRYRCFDNLTDLFGDKAVHSYEFPDLRRSYTLRYTGVSDFHTAYPAFSLATLSLVEDDPTPGGTSAGGGDVARGTPIDLSAYGVQTLEGTLSDSAAPLPAKQNLIVPIEGAQAYDDKVVHYAPRDATVHCLMTARDITEFNANHTALLRHLLEPGMRALTIEGVGTCQAFYRSCASIAFYFTPAPLWWRFNLTFTVNTRD